MNMLGEESFDHPIQIDRAHRSPQPLWEGRSRAFIVRLHHYQVKEQILCLARSKTLQYEGKAIRLFPDLAADVLKQRQKFDSMRKKCWEHEVRCGFHFPSKLIVTVRDKETKTFDSPEAAEAYLLAAVEDWWNGQTTVLDNRRDSCVYKSIWYIGKTARYHFCVFCKMSGGLY